jgi:hypothetical protein
LHESRTEFLWLFLFNQGSRVHNMVHLLLSLMEMAASTSEMLVNFYQTTWQNNPEDSHLHTHCHENLKFHNPQATSKQATSWPGE